MRTWLEFAGAVLLVGTLLWLLWRGNEPDDRLVAAGPTLLVHIASDGETLEYPTSWEFPWDEVAETLGQIAALPEIAA